MKRADNFKPKKILIIQLRQLGDVLLTTPVIKALRGHYPDAHIAFLTEENAYDILSGNPFLDEIIAIKRKQGYLDQLRNIMDIRKKKFDLVLDFLINPRTAYITFLSGAKVTISYDVPWRGLLYKIRVKGEGDYVVDQKFSLLSPLGIEGKDVTPYIHVPEEASGKIKRFLESSGIKEDDFLLCIDATHRRVARKWTGEGFAGIADRIKEEYGAKVVFLRGPGEHDEVEKIMSMCKHRHLISPETSLKEFTALIKRADLLVGNCSFPRHVAASQGTPSLVILGATGEEWTHPAPIHQTVKKGLDCHPCKKICEELTCLGTLSIDEVMAGLERLKPYIEKLKKPAEF